MPRSCTSFLVGVHVRGPRSMFLFLLSLCLSLSSTACNINKHSSVRIKQTNQKQQQQQNPPAGTKSPQLPQAGPVQPRKPSNIPTAPEPVGDLAPGKHLGLLVIDMEPGSQPWREREQVCPKSPSTLYPVCEQFMHHSFVYSFTFHTFPPS